MSVFGAGLGGLFKASGSPAPADATVDKMRRWVSERMGRAVSASTAAEYARVYERLVRDGRRAGSSENGRTRSVERSAYRYHAARRLDALLKSGDVREAAKIWSELNAIEREAREARQAYEKRLEAGEKPPSTQQRHTKRVSLRGMPSDWREQLVSAAKESRYAKEIQVIALCGCRPAELVRGVTVTRSASGDLVLRIEGAKVSERTGGGQSWREVTIDADHPLAVGLEDGRYAVPKAKAIEEAVAHFAKRLWPGKKAAISAYSLRHAFASDVKASEVEIEAQAQALGHASTATMQRYGTTSGRGKGGLTVRRVSAEKEPRSTISTGKTRRRRMSR